LLGGYDGPFHVSACALQLLSASDLLLSPKIGAEQPPTFQPMSTVAKQSPISATAEHLLYSFAAFDKISTDIAFCGPSAVAESVNFFLPQRMTNFLHIVLVILHFDIDFSTIYIVCLFTLVLPHLSFFLYFFLFYLFV